MMNYPDPAPDPTKKVWIRPDPDPQPCDEDTDIC